MGGRVRGVQEIQKKPSQTRLQHRGAGGDWMEAQSKAQESRGCPSNIRGFRGFGAPNRFFLWGCESGARRDGWWSRDCVGKPVQHPFAAERPFAAREPSRPFGVEKNRRKQGSCCWVLASVGFFERAPQRSAAVSLLFSVPLFVEEKGQATRRAGRRQTNSLDAFATSHLPEARTHKDTLFTRWVAKYTPVVGSLSVHRPRHLALQVAGGALRRFDRSKHGCVSNDGSPATKNVYLIFWSLFGHLLASPPAVGQEKALSISL